MVLRAQTRAGKLCRRDAVRDARVSAALIHSSGRSTLLKGQVMMGAAPIIGGEATTSVPSVRNSTALSDTASKFGRETQAHSAWLSRPSGPMPPPPGSARKRRQACRPPMGSPAPQPNRAHLNRKHLHPPPQAARRPRACPNDDGPYDGDVHGL